MTTTDLPRLTNVQLQDIGTRLRQPMTDEGVRAFYRQDVTSLVAEVLYLRRDHSRALSVFQNNPPLHDVPETADMADIAQQLAEVWVQQEAGLWKDDETRRLRDHKNAALDEAEAAHKQAQALEGQIASLRTENAQIGQLQSALVASRDREQDAVRRIDAFIAEIASLNEQLSTLTQHRDHLQKVANAQLTEIRKRDQIAAQTRSVLSRAPEPGRGEPQAPAVDLEQIASLQDQIATLTRHRDHLQTVANGQLTQIRTLSAQVDRAKATLDEAASTVRQQTPADEQRYEENAAIHHQGQLKDLQDQVRTLMQDRDRLRTVANTQLSELNVYREVTDSARGLLEG